MAHSASPALPELLPDAPVRERGFRIGCIGAGMIMAECHLAAYRQVDFPVVAIASRPPARAREVAQRYGIGTVYDTPQALVDEPQVQEIGRASCRERGWQ